MERADTLTARARPATVRESFFWADTACYDERVSRKIAVIFRSASARTPSARRIAP